MGTSNQSLVYSTSLVRVCRFVSLCSGVLTYSKSCHYSSLGALLGTIFSLPFLFATLSSHGL